MDHDDRSIGHILSGREILAFVRVAVTSKHHGPPESPMGKQDIALLSQRKHPGR